MLGRRSGWLSSYLVVVVDCPVLVDGPVVVGRGGRWSCGGWSWW